MKTKETSKKEMVIVYRKDGKTPDLRYKSSRDIVLAQSLEKYEKHTQEGKTSDFKYKSFRDNVVSKQTEKNRINPVQIKPTGKKPVWKVTG
jgi:hypothetical protein